MESVTVRKPASGPCKVVNTNRGFTAGTIEIKEGVMILIDSLNGFVELFGIAFN